MTTSTRAALVMLCCSILTAPACGPEPTGDPEAPAAAEGGVVAVECPTVPAEECTAPSGAVGERFCLVVEGEEVRTDCLEEEAIGCYPGEGFDMGCFGTRCEWDGERFVPVEWAAEGECGTPLVVQFSAGPVGFSASPAGASFDFGSPALAGCATDWPQAPWLALDRDGDGSIAGGRELFGDGVTLASGARARHGFAALAELDVDGDGRLTAADPEFARLVLWSDADADRIGAAAETVRLVDVGVLAIHLAYGGRATCDARGNCERERASFEFVGADGATRVGEVVDVYLACQ